MERDADERAANGDAQRGEDSPGADARQEEEASAESGGSDARQQDPAAESEGGGGDARQEAGDSDGSGESDARQESGGSGDPGDADEQEVTAPSVGPNTEFNREPPEERLARHEQTTEDAMGHDKRREVIGGQYGASKRRQLTLYGAALGVLALLVVGAIFAVNEFDKPRDSRNADAAPWSQIKRSEQVPVRPVTFPRNGKQPLEVPDSGTGGTENSGGSPGSGSAQGSPNTAGG